MHTLYDSKLSGNAWKIRLLMRHLGLPFRRETMNLVEGKQKTEAFTARNRFQRVPVLELEDGTCLAESNAILTYLAEGSALFPSEPVARAGVMAWLFYEQADLLRFLAFPRFFSMTGQAEARADLIAQYKAIGESALKPVEQALAASDWLCGNAPSIADFAMYPYIRMAPEGGYDLTPFPAIQAWLARFETLPGYEPLVAAEPV